MHFAGSVVVPESVSDPLKYYRNNTAASRALIESAVARACRTSSSRRPPRPMARPRRCRSREDDPTVPINPYGMSKLMTEAMLRDVAAAHPMQLCALRYFNVAGADPQGRTGQSTPGATHLIKVAVEAAIGKRARSASTAPTFRRPTAPACATISTVSDLAAAHVAALAYLRRGGASTTLNAATAAASRCSRCSTPSSGYPA